MALKSKTKVLKRIGLGGFVLYKREIIEAEIIDLKFEGNTAECPGLYAWTMQYNPMSKELAFPKKTDWQQWLIDTISFCLLNLIKQKKLNLILNHKKQSFFNGLLKNVILEYDLEVVGPANSADPVSHQFLIAIEKAKKTLISVVELENIITLFFDFYTSRQETSASKVMLGKILEQYACRFPWLEYNMDRKLLGLKRVFTAQVTGGEIAQFAKEASELKTQGESILDNQVKYSIFQPVLERIIRAEIHRRIPST